MTAPVFVDTNVLVYARDASELVKGPQARAWLEYLWRTELGRVSFQVLQEYYVTVTRKLQPGLSPAEARIDLRLLAAWNPLSLEPSLLEGAWQIEDRYGLSWWDALIVAAADRCGCQTLLSEDLQHDQQYGGVRVASPFRSAPPTA